MNLQATVKTLSVDALSPENAHLAKSILADIKTKLAEIPRSKDDTKLLRLMLACALVGVGNLVALCFWAFLPPSGDLKRLD